MVVLVVMMGLSWGWWGCSWQSIDGGDGIVMGVVVVTAFLREAVVIAVEGL